MRRIEFRRSPEADVAVLSRNLELWPVIRDVVRGMRVTEIETIGAPIGFIDATRILRTARSAGTSLGYASMVAKVRSSRVKVLVAVDQSIEVIEELGRLMPEIPQVLIAHGSTRPEVLVDFGKITRRAHRILGVWGQADVDTYSKNVPDGVSCFVVGSLRNAGYLRRHPLDASRQPQRPLLFVSQYSGVDEEREDSPQKRVQILFQIKNHLRRYCEKHHLPLTVALRPPASATLEAGQTDAERNHYLKVFSGLQIEFTDPASAHSTYLASDYADVTIGVPTGALTESFGRGNKVLMIRQAPASGTYYGFPVEGDWLLTEPTYEEFSVRLDKLRAMSRETCATAWRVPREYVCANAESDSPIELVRECVGRILDTTT